MKIRKKLIEKFIAENDFTKEEFAQSAGISNDALRKILIRDVNCRLKTVGRIAKVMRMNYDDLVIPSGE